MKHLTLKATLLSLALLLTTSGCEGIDPASFNYEQALEQSRQVLEDSEADLADLSAVILDSEAYLSTLEPDDPLAETLRDNLADARMRMRQIEKVRADAERAISQLQIQLAANPDRDVLDNVLLTLNFLGQDVAPTVPGPAGTVLGLGGLIAGGLYRARSRRNEKAAASIVASVEQVKQENNGVVDFNKPEIKEKLRAAQNKDAQELVAKQKIARKNVVLPEA